MNCPACGNVLQEMKIEDITLDVCKGGCGGIWFDQFELRKMDEPHESLGESLLHVDHDPNVTVDHSERRSCPKCHNMIMMRHFFSFKRDIEVDECPNCAGFWLDHGELGKLRDQFETEAERDEATQDYFTEVFDEKLAELSAESEENSSKARKIARIFRFLCPSYYLRGKQRWGAF